MPERILTGSRIRERRIARGLKQGELARVVGISPSYLNLIEHNRRRIAGKLLSDLAGALDIEPSVLSEGADSVLVDALSAAISELNRSSQSLRRVEVEADQIEDLCARFPGWAGGLVACLARNERLERMVVTLSDRLAHDPQLSASLHEVLSRVTAIHSTSSILMDSDGLDANWRNRFQKNLHEDATRLSESSKALVGYLDRAGDAEHGRVNAQEDLERYLAHRGYHLSELEAGDWPELPEFLSRDAVDKANSYFARYRDDALALPQSVLEQIVETEGTDPFELAFALNLPVQLVMRRLASLPKLEIGLASCDGSGALLFRKPLAGFAIPQLGAACALWPIFESLRIPGNRIEVVIAQAGRNRRAFRAYAFAETTYPQGHNGPAIVRAEMMLVPTEFSENARPVGSNCRVCAEPACPARREPSLLSTDVAPDAI